MPANKQMIYFLGLWGIKGTSYHMKRRKELADKENRTCKYPVSFFPKTPKNEWIHEKQLLYLKFLDFTCSGPR